MSFAWTSFVGVLLGATACRIDRAERSTDNLPVGPACGAAEDLALRWPRSLTGEEHWCVARGQEREEHRHVCSERQMSTRDWMAAWVSVLERSGYVVETHERITMGSEDGSFALRFRQGDLFGDLYAHSVGRHCWDCVVRAMRPVRVEGPLRWKSPFAFPDMFAGLMEPWRYCARVFPRDDRFPFVPGTYEYGCAGDHWK
jgi:hypothetical protein